MSLRKEIIQLLLQDREVEARSLVFTDLGKMSEARAYIDKIKTNLQSLTLPQNNSSEILSLLLTNQKLKAVKLLKEITGKGLKEAKNQLDQIDNILNKEA